MIDRFTVAELPQWYPFREYHRRLVFDGRPVGVTIDGDTIAVQVTHQDHFVLVTEYDAFETAEHWVYLINADARVIDKVSLPESFGFVKDFQSTDDGQYSFQLFDSQDVWNLEIDLAGKHSFTFHELIRRPNRFMFSKRRLLLSCRSDSNTGT